MGVQNTIDDDDTARGAPQIALEYWGDAKHHRRVYNDKIGLPLFYEKGKLCAFKSALRAHKEAVRAQQRALRERMTAEVAAGIPMLLKPRGRSATKEEAVKSRRRNRRP